MSDVADKLREARAVMVERGWTRGEYCRDGRVCIFGALNVAFCGNPDPSFISARGYTEAINLLKDATGASGLVSFNDRQRSKKPVLQAFDRAIELAEQSA